MTKNESANEFLDATIRAEGRNLAKAATSRPWYAVSPIWVNNLRIYAQNKKEIKCLVDIYEEKGFKCDFDYPYKHIFIYWAGDNPYRKPGEYEY